VGDGLPAGRHVGVDLTRNRSDDLDLRLGLVAPDVVRRRVDGRGDRRGRRDARRLHVDARGRVGPGTERAEVTVDGRRGGALDGLEGAARALTHLAVQAVERAGVDGEVDGDTRLFLRPRVVDRRRPERRVVRGQG